MNPINSSMGSQMAASVQQDAGANQIAALKDALQIQATAQQQLVQNMEHVGQNSAGGSLLNTFA